MAQSKRDQNMLRQLVASGNLRPSSDSQQGKTFDRQASQAAAIAARKAELQKQVHVSSKYKYHDRLVSA